MNLIVLMLDSLRQDHVSAYGWPDVPVKTPHLDALAAEGVLFDNIYPEGLPTIPVRTDLFTGQSSLTNRRWQPLVSTDVAAAEVFRKEGYLTALVADTYHLFKPDMNFHRGFDIFHWIRGAEYDSIRCGEARALRLQDHLTPRMPASWHAQVRVVLRNLEGRSEPEDFPCWQTVEKALEVLEGARRQEKPLFLWLDTFQPHEPWCPPARFDTFGDPAYKGPKIVMPPGGPADAWGTPAEIARTRSLYAGEAAYVDYCMGCLLEGARRLGYFDDSTIVALSDHGHPLADHGKFLKGGDRMYSELLKVPFIVRLPKGAHGGRRVRDLGRFPDLLPTLLDLAGLSANNRSMAGSSLRPVLEGAGPSSCRATVSGYFDAQERCIRDERYSYVLRPPGEKDQLFDLLEDPRETRDLLAEKPDVARRLVAAIGAVYFGRKAKPRGLQGAFETAHTPLA
jgi:arylsulfatase A-like enzyme